MDLQSLKYFLAVAKYGSFTKAAESLFTSQPNISKHITRLEAELGAPLFIRGGKKIKLTYIGEKLLAEIEEIIPRLEQLPDKIKKYALGEIGHLRVGYNGSFHHDYIAGIMSSFCSKYPEIEISLENRLIEADLVNALLKDELDVIIASASATFDSGDNICSRVLAANELIVVTPKRHRFNKYPIIKTKDLASERIITFPRKMHGRFYDWLVKSVLGSNTKNLTVENDPKNILLKVAAGKGITIFSTLMVRGINQTIHTVKLDYNRNELDVNLTIYWKSTNKNPSLSLLLQKICKNKKDCKLA